MFVFEGDVWGGGGADGAHEAAAGVPRRRGGQSGGDGDPLREGENREHACGHGRGRGQRPLQRHLQALRGPQLRLQGVLQEGGAGAHAESAGADRLQPAVGSVAPVPVIYGVVFDTQDYSWEDHGFSLVNRLYPDVGQMLDEKFQLAYNLTYNTMATHKDVDTSMLRRAIWNYIHCMFGIRSVPEQLACHGVKGNLCMLTNGAFACVNQI